MTVINIDNAKWNDLAHEAIAGLTEVKFNTMLQVFEGKYNQGKKVKKQQKLAKIIQSAT